MLAKKSRKKWIFLNAKNVKKQKTQKLKFGQHYSTCKIYLLQALDWRTGWKCSAHFLCPPEIDGISPPPLKMYLLDSDNTETIMREQDTVLHWSVQDFVDTLDIVNTYFQY